MEKSTLASASDGIAVGTIICCHEVDLIVPQIERMLALCDKVVVLADAPPIQMQQILQAFTSEKVNVIITEKDDPQAQRDEWGDRSRVFNRAKELGARLTYHTDVDELLDLRDMQRVKDLIRMNDGSKCYAFPRYDMWGSAYHYRIPYSTDAHAGHMLRDVPPPGQSTYIIPCRDEMFYRQQPIPNFHCPREPVFCPKPELINDVRVIHYGYYTEQKRQEKESFYEHPAAGNTWNEDMQVTLEEFKERWGIGLLSR